MEELHILLLPYLRFQWQWDIVDGDGSMGGPKLRFLSSLGKLVTIRLSRDVDFLEYDAYILRCGEYSSVIQCHFMTSSARAAWRLLHVQ